MKKIAENEQAMVALGEEIARIESPVPVGSVDASLYRDDIGLRPVSPGAVSDLAFDLDGATVVLVDDVLFTGRTVRAALDAVADYGLAIGISTHVSHLANVLRANQAGHNPHGSHYRRVRLHAGQQRPD